MCLRSCSFLLGTTGKGALVYPGRGHRVLRRATSVLGPREHLFGQPLDEKTPDPRGCLQVCLCGCSVFFSSPFLFFRGAGSVHLGGRGERIHFGGRGERVCFPGVAPIEPMR